MTRLRTTPRDAYTSPSGAIYILCLPNCAAYAASDEYLNSPIYVSVSWLCCLQSMRCTQISPNSQSRMSAYTTFPQRVLPGMQIYASSPLFRPSSPAGTVSFALGLAPHPPIPRRLTLTAPGAPSYQRTYRGSPVLEDVYPDTWLLSPSRAGRARPAGRTPPATRGRRAHVGLW